MLAFWSWIKAPDEISISERRKLAAFPEFTGESLLSGKFSGDFEEYSLDQFPLREEFRSLQAVSSLYLFREKDNHGIYLEKGFLAKMEPSLDPDSVKRAAEKLEKLYTAYMKGKTHRIYVSVIPDKSYYLAEPGGYPSMDYEKLFSVMKEELDFAAYLDLTEVLEAEDYYRTDTHWRQERITGSGGISGGSHGRRFVRNLYPGAGKRRFPRGFITARRPFRYREKPFISCGIRYWINAGSGPWKQERPPAFTTRRPWREEIPMRCIFPVRLRC